MEEMRIEKDQEIKRLTLEMEKQRSEYELEINKLTQALNKC